MFKAHHTAITTRDYQKSLDFYKLFDFETKLEWVSEDGDIKIAHMKLGNYCLEIFWYKNHSNISTVEEKLNDDLKNSGIRHFGIEVDSIEDAKKYVEGLDLASNIEIKLGRTGIRYFFLNDPDGLHLEIVEDKRNL